MTSLIQSNNNQLQKNLDQIPSLKFNSNEEFIPYSILERNIIEHDVPYVNIDEKDTDIFYLTIHGYGIINFNNGMIYNGNVKYGILDADLCQIRFDNNTIYRGSIKNNQLNSEKAVFEFDKDKEIQYEGGVVNGYRHGKGIYKNPTLNISYTGEWKNGLKNGKGEMIKNNFTYNGDWVDGQKEGKGVCIWKFQNYENYFGGEFVNNKINGKGYMIWNEKNEKYVGRWRDNQRHGYGIQIWYDQKGDNKILKNRYCGEWKNNYRNGYGIFYYSNGSKYEGEWSDNKKNGYGIYTNSDGVENLVEYDQDKIIKIIDLNKLLSQVNSQYQLNLTYKSTTSMNSNTNINTSNSGHNRKMTKQDSNTSVNNEEKQGQVGGEDSKSKKGNVVFQLQGNNSPVQSPPTHILKENNKQKVKNNKVNKILNSKKGLEIIDEDKELTDEYKNTVNSFDSPVKEKRLKQVNQTNQSVAQIQAEPSGQLQNLNKIGSKKNTSTSIKAKDLKNTTDMSMKVVNDNQSQYSVVGSMIDIEDIYESNAELENERDNINKMILKYLSEMKGWYKTLSAIDFLNTKDVKETGKSLNQTNLNQSNNQSVIEDGRSKLKKKSIRHISNKSKIDTQGILEIIPKGDKVNNEIGYLVKISHIWKFIKDNELFGKDQPIADLNRNFFRGKRSSFSLFKLMNNTYNSSNDHDDVQIETDVYSLINRQVEYEKYLFIKKLEKLESQNELKLNIKSSYNTMTINSNKDSENQKDKENYDENLFNINDSDKKNNAVEISEDQHNENNQSGLAFKIGKLNENFYSSEFDIHDPDYYLLPRQFYEIIIRIVYFKYLNSKLNPKYEKQDITFSKRIRDMIDSILKKQGTNMNTSTTHIYNNQIQTENNNFFKLPDNEIDKLFPIYSQKLKGLFMKIHYASHEKYKKSYTSFDKTVSYRFIYYDFIKKFKFFDEIDLSFYCLCINNNHIDKRYITEENKYQFEVYTYINTILDIEIIFYEFCELIFNLYKKIEKGYLTLEMIIFEMNQMKFQYHSKDYDLYKEKTEFTYPKRDYHRKFEDIIRLEMEEKERVRLQKIEYDRYVYENQRMSHYENNLLQGMIDDDEEEEFENESNDQSYYSEN